jgi:hypothetical protein
MNMRSSSKVPLKVLHISPACRGLLSCSYCQHKIRSAKRSARSELSVTRGEWSKHGYAASDVLSTEGLIDEVPRIHASVSSTPAWLRCPACLLPAKPALQWRCHTVTTTQQQECCMARPLDFSTEG